MRAVVLLSLLVGCGPAPELGPDSAFAELAYTDRHVDAVVTTDADMDGLADLWVLSDQGPQAQVDLYLGAELADGGWFAPEDAYARFRGEILGLQPGGDLDEDGGEGIAMGNETSWSLFDFDELERGGVYAAVDAPITVHVGLPILAVTAGDVVGSDRQELIVAVYQPGFDCGSFCGWYRPREQAYAVNADEVLRVGGVTPDSPRQLFHHDILDAPDPSDHPFLVVGDVDGDGRDDIASGGRRNWAAVGLDRGTTTDTAQVASRQVWHLDCYTDSEIPRCSDRVRVRGAGDVDHDGRADLVSYVEGQSSVLVSSGSAIDREDRTSRFSHVDPVGRRLKFMSTAVGIGPVDRVAGDDLLFASSESGAATVRRWGPQMTVSVLYTGFGSTPLEVYAAGDVDGDGYGDGALVSDYGTWVSLVAPGASLRD